MAKYEVTIFDTGQKLLALALRYDGQKWVCDSTYELMYEQYMPDSMGDLSSDDDSVNRIFVDDQESTDSGSVDLSEDLNLEAEDIPSLPTDKLVGWLDSLDGKSFKVTHIPSSKQASYFLFKDQNYNNFKKKALKARISEKLKEISDLPVSEENFVYRLRSDGSVMTAMLDERLPSVQMLEELTTHFGQRLKVHSIIPQEEILLHMLKQRGGESATIVHLQAGVGKLLTVEAGSLNQPINLDIQGENSESRARTIVQRLMFEIEKGSIESLNEVYISASPEEIGYIRDLLVQNIPELEVYSLTSEYNGDDLEEVQNMTLSYAAIPTSQMESVISFLPNRIQERQQVFRLKWHGGVLLLLLLATPWAINELYQDKSAAYENYLTENRQLESQISDLRPIVDELQERDEEFQRAQDELEALKEDSRLATKWTQLISELQDGMSGIPNTWLTDYRSSGNTLIIEGYTIYRSRINDVAGIYPQSRIERVQQGEMRGHTIYSFAIRVSNVNSQIDPPLETDQQLLTESGAE